MEDHRRRLLCRAVCSPYWDSHEDRPLVYGNPYGPWLSKLVFKCFSTLIVTTFSRYSSSLHCEASQPDLSTLGLVREQEDLLAVHA